jgi:hypothetical protein
MATAVWGFGVGGSPSVDNSMHDFLIGDHGSIAWIVPVSPAAHEWLDENAVSEPWWQGGALSV